jgi:hypothetical protein
MVVPPESAAMMPRTMKSVAVPDDGHREVIQRTFASR